MVQPGAKSSGSRHVCSFLNEYLSLSVVFIRCSEPHIPGHVLEYVEEDGHGIRRTNAIRLRHYDKIVQMDDAIASRKVWRLTSG